MRAALVVVTLVLVSSLAHAQTAPTFDWTMRHGTSGGFILKFDACPSWQHGFPTTTVSHTWTIGLPPNAPFKAVIVGPTTSCSIDFPFSSEGTYPVTLKTAAGAITKDVVVQDWVIVAIGDSIGSGEGNPDVPLQVGEWQEALADLDAAVAALAQSPRAADIVALTQDAIAKTDDLIYCLGADRHVLDTWFGDIVYYTPRRCLWDPVYLTNKIINLNGVLLRINELALTTVVDQIDFSVNLLNPFHAIKTALQTFKQAQQALIDAVPLAQQVVADLEEGLSTEWLDRRCHRSRISGQAMAAAEIERLDPHTTVSFIHLACSGAQILDGLLSPWIGREPPKGAFIIPLPPQVEAAVERVAGREVDAILVSIGGNDARFSEVAKSCTVQNPCSDTEIVRLEPFDFTALCLAVAWVPGMASQCLAYEDSLSEYNSTTGAMMFSGGLSTLPVRYQQLRDALVAGFPVMADDPARVLITEYPDGSRDTEGDFCGSPSADPLNNFPGMTLDEWMWVGNSMMPALNAAVRLAADAHHWTFVDGIFAGFARHGYCATDNWFVRLQDSFVRQGDQFGTLHPNEAGQRTIATQIVASLRSLLYENGNLSSPRRPFHISETGVEPVPPEITANATSSDGPEYVADTWTRQAVTVHYTCEDLSGSGLAGCSADQIFDASGVTPLATGTATDNGGRSATASFGPIKIDRANPSITASATNADGTPYDGVNWANEPVTVRYACADFESGIATCTPDRVFAMDGSTASAVGTATDSVGNLAETSLGPILVDQTAPTIESSATSADGTPYNAGTWTNRAVTVQFRCADATSGVPDDACGHGDLWPDVPRAADVEVGSTDGVTELTGTANDRAGNSRTITFGPIRFDTTPPTLAFGALNPAANAAGWHNTDVTIDFTTADNLSGVESATPAAPLQLTAEGHGRAATVIVRDRAGNAASFESASANIDKTAPEVTIGSPLANHTYLQNEVVASGYDCADTLSGIARCTGVVASGANLPTGTVGQQEFSVEVIDVAGNITNINLPYLVITVADGLHALLRAVEAMNIKQGIANSLDAKLDAVLQAVDAANAGQRQDALNKLQAFVNAVEAQRGNSLTDEQASTLIQEAMRIAAILSSF